MTFDDHLRSLVKAAVVEALAELGASEPQRLLTVEEAARELNGRFSPAAIRGLCRSGALPHIRTTDSDNAPIWIRPEALRETMRRLETGSTPHSGLSKKQAIR